MHDSRVFFYQGYWYGICTCGWQSGGFLHRSGAIVACGTHEDSQLN